MNADLLLTETDGLVKKLAHSWASRNEEVDFDDLCQEGRLGVLRAAELFREELGVKFSTFAFPHINSRMRIWLHKTRDTVRVPSNLFGVVRVLTTPLDEPVNGDGRSLAETVSAPEASEGDPMAREALDALTVALKRLPKKKREILEKRFWQRRTLDDVAKDYGVTREAVRKQQRQALLLLRRSAALKIHLEAFA